MSDRLVKFRVHLIIGIKQVKFDTTHISYPYRSMHLIVGVRHINNHWVSVVIIYTLYRNRVEVLGLILSYLLPVHAKCLCKISKTIEETYGTHVHIAVRSLLYIVTGKHTKTARINLQCRVNTIFHTEICHRRTSAVRLNVHVCTELLVKRLYALHECLVFHDFFLTLVAETLQEQYRIVLYL